MGVVLTQFQNLSLDSISAPPSSPPPSMTSEWLQDYVIYVGNYVQCINCSLLQLMTLYYTPGKGKLIHIMTKCSHSGKAHEVH